jgi:TPR repeat protein
MHTHFKFHSIFSIGALLICTLSGQTSAAQNETVCGTGDFRAFFQKFAASPVLQQASIATPLTLQTLSDDPSLRVKLEKLSAAQRPSILVPHPEQWAELGLIPEWLPPSTVVLRGHQGEYLRTFVFKRQSCWVLKRVENWTLGGPKLTTNASPQTNAQQCLKRARAYERLGSTEQTSSTQALFAAALDSYLCAADAGSLEASYAAATLSLSGQAPRLQNTRIQALLEMAAKTHPDAALALSDFYCNEGDYESERVCANPEDAAQALIAAARMGSADALNQLGYSYETGTLVEQDSSRALACYTSAAGKGSARAEKNVKRLATKGVPSNEQVKCIQAGRQP